MDAPQEYKTAGIFMLISGIMTVMVSRGLVFGLIWICVGVFWILTLAAGIFEIILGVGVMNGQPKANAKTVSIIGIVAALLCGNVVGMVMEIMAVVNLGKPEVANWLAMQGE
mgnify:CR=1 FL=1